MLIVTHVYVNRLKPADRRTRGPSLKFHEPGKFMRRAQQIRTKVQLESLHKQIEEAARRTGISSAARLAVLQPKVEVPQPTRIITIRHQYLAVSLPAVFSLIF